LEQERDLIKEKEATGKEEVEVTEEAEEDNKIDRSSSKKCRT
jgi:hypothetical protein